MMISSCLRVLLSDERTNEQTDICDCRVAFVTENCWYHCHLYPNCWKFLTNFTVVAEVFSEILHISRISMAYQGIFSKHTIKRLISIQSGLLSSRILKATFQWMTLSKCHDPTPWKWKSFLARLIFKAKLKTQSRDLICISISYIIELNTLYQCNVSDPTKVSDPLQPWYLLFPSCWLGPVVH